MSILGSWLFMDSLNSTIIGNNDERDIYEFNDDDSSTIAALLPPFSQSLNDDANTTITTLMSSLSQSFNDGSSTTAIAIPCFTQSFNQQEPNLIVDSNSNPLWGGTNSLDSVPLISTETVMQNTVYLQPTVNMTATEDNLMSSLFNPSVVLTNKTLGDQLPSNNINSEFFNHPRENFVFSSVESSYSSYSHTEESVFPPSSNDSYLQVDEEIESTDSDEGPTSANGGYDYEFVRLKEIEDEDLFCPICRLVSREPQQSECCGKVFCKVCIDKLKCSETYNLKCPSCRKEPVLLFADKRSSRSISNFIVYCRRKQKGCLWFGTLCEAERHFEQCLHQRVPCPNACGKRPQRKHVEKHIENFCANRQYQCEDCHTTGQWAFITGEHTEQCLEKIVECFNEGCGYRFSRRNIEEHQRNCPKELLRCHYSDIGCKITCKREEMSTHDTKHMSNHLECAAKVARAFVTPHKDHLLQVAPAVIRILNFSTSNELRSHSFLTSLKGYKICLLLNKEANRQIEFKFCLMPGLYDSNLSWPFCGRLILLLLNQKEDRHHHEMSVTLPSGSGVPRVVSRHSDFGESVVIDKLKLSEHRDMTATDDVQLSLDFENLGYLLDDVMSIRVSFETIRRKIHSSLSGKKKAKLSSQKHH